MKHILNDVKEIMISNINHHKSFVAQLIIIIFILSCAYFQQSYRLEYYYNTILGRIMIVSLIALSCNYRYMFVTIALVICIFFISFKTYEGFSLTDVDSISSSIKSTLPASIVSLPPNPTPQNIYDYLNKQVCATGNADIYKQIIESPSSSDDAKLLATNALGFNTALCKSGAPFYQKPQALFDDFKNSCNSTLSGNDKKMADLASSISADANSSNIFSAPLIAISKWFSTTRSAVCGAAATTTTPPAATPSSNSPAKS
jgi:hypothetical protein